MLKILLISDDPVVIKAVKETLTHDYHNIYVSSAKECKSYLTTAELLILDIEHENLDPAGNINAIYSCKRPGKNVLLLVNEEQVERLNGQEDDFIIKPLRRPELRTRVRRLSDIRKTLEHEIIRSERLEIDVTNCDVTLSGKVIDLTFTEYQLLRYLANHAGRVLTRDIILSAVWGTDYFGGDRTVDVHIQRLRGKLDDGQGDFIQTVRNIGYRFVINTD